MPWYSVNGAVARCCLNTHITNAQNAADVIVAVMEGSVSSEKDRD